MQNTIEELHAAAIKCDTLVVATPVHKLDYFTGKTNLVSGGQSRGNLPSTKFCFSFMVEHPVLHNNQDFCFQIELINKIDSLASINKKSATNAKRNLENLDMLADIRTHFLSRPINCTFRPGVIS